MMSISSPSETDVSRKRARFESVGAEIASRFQHVTSELVSLRSSFNEYYEQIGTLSQRLERIQQSVPLPITGRGRQLNLEQGSADWQLIRTGRIGMSQAGSVFGCHSTVYHYFEACLRGREEPSELAAARMQAGTNAEPIIRSAYGMTLGCGVVDGETFIPDTGYSDLDCALIASTDGRVEQDRLVEIKFPRYGLYSPKKHVSGVPLYYLYQMMGQMGITGFSCCDFVSLCEETREARVVRVHFSPQLWNWMWPKLVLFWKWCNTGVFPVSRVNFEWPAAPLHTVRFETGVVNEVNLVESYFCIQSTLQLAQMEAEEQQNESAWEQAALMVQETY